MPTALDRVRKICLALPGVEEKLAHGRPAFAVRDRTFVMFMDNHHNDGRLALWCKSTHDTQDFLVHADSKRFFVPPYVGHQGWVGIRLEGRAPWGRIADVIETGCRLSSAR
ncbi:MAG: MmcQ/YjbR family DNA-binding protein [Planctomycetes bacterium]|nr:MmcQ/YjbR family DNA-binding protein [Planctomycetota bacterium]